jgi:uncharacterized protein
MNKNAIVDETAKFVQKSLKGEETGHDWWHSLRVWKMAKHIADGEKVDSYVIELASLLHDIDDYKFAKHNTNLEHVSASKWLEQIKVDKVTIDQVVKIINETEYTGSKDTQPATTTEGKIVQDADRLDAMGAIGIARTFAYGGKVKRPIHDPKYQPRKNQNSKNYRLNKGTSIGHFYEKLLLIGDMMNTKTAKRISKKRERFLQKYLVAFYDEWNCNL